MMKKRIIVFLLTVSVTIPMVTGCGLLSPVSTISKVAKLAKLAKYSQTDMNESIEYAAELKNAIADSGGDADAVISNLTANLLNNEEFQAIKEIADIYYGDAYTSKEYWELLNDELENLYQEDLRTNPDAIPTRMADTPDGLSYIGDITIFFSKELADIDSKAEIFYYGFEDYFIEPVYEYKNTAQYALYGTCREEFQ